MATLLQSQPYDVATANFNLWTGFIRQLFLTTSAWTQTADTGQTNPTTVVTAPTTGNFIYEIYQATDALSSTSPIVAKVEYGQLGSAPSIAITIGPSTNGSGIVNGGGYRFVINKLIDVPGNTYSGSAYDCIGSGDASGVRFMMWRNYAGTNPKVVPCFFAIERSRDSSGAYIGDYITIYCYGWGFDGVNFTQPLQFRQQTMFLPSGGAGNEETSWLTFQTTLASAGLGTNVAAVPLFPMPGYLGNPSLDLLCAKGGDFSEASTGNVLQVYGTTHNYYFSKVADLGFMGGLVYSPIGSTSIDPDHISSNQGLLFRYE